VLITSVLVVVQHYRRKIHTVTIQENIHSDLVVLLLVLLLVVVDLMVSVIHGAVAERRDA